jgi:hypothetical protein
MAVDLAKLSLWLATMAKDHPFTFLDHSIKCGDSLVGLTRRQIECFTWETGFTTGQLWEQEVRRRVASALEQRKNLLALGDELTSPELKRQKLDLAEESLNTVRFIGDAAIAAFFAADNDKARETKRAELAERIAEYLRTGDLTKRPTEEVKALRSGQFPVSPFHWEIEFPEVFDRENPGFDAIVGNPPFLGGKRITSVSGESYRDWLTCLHTDSNSNSDLVAHFFRRAFDCIYKNGCFGLIATNTICQGDTRSTGLRWICTNGGTIYAVRKRYKWPGQAAVVVSVVWVIKCKQSGFFDLDGRKVSLITAYLFHAGGHESPERLCANDRKCFIGYYVHGMGFTFDDNDTKGAASSLSLMRELVASDSRNGDRIFPYIGGEEINDSPNHAPRRYVINFGDMTEEKARSWPQLMQVLEEKAKPESQKSNNLRIKRDWWLFEYRAPELQSVIGNQDRVIVRSRIGNAFAFTMLSSRIVMNEKTVVFPFDSYIFFSAIQSRVHEIWALFFSSTLKDDLQYTPTDCFETFPFPPEWETNAALEEAGKAYYEFRADLMIRNDEGLTKTYNRFHDPEERSPDIQRLRALHAAMDRAVLDAYGWPDIPTACEFLLDYEEEDEETENTGKKRQKKKPYRLRWPDEIRDEVLARLLALNAERAAQEKLSGTAPGMKAAKKTKPKKSEEDFQLE